MTPDLNWDIKMFLPCLGESLGILLSGGTGFLNQSWNIILWLLTMYIHQQVLILIPKHRSQRRLFIPILVNSALFHTLAIYQPVSHAISSQKLPLSSDLTPEIPLKPKGGTWNTDLTTSCHPSNPFKWPRQMRPRTRCDWLPVLTWSMS